MHVKVIIISGKYFVVVVVVPEVIKNLFAPDICTVIGRIGVYIVVCIYNDNVDKIDSPVIKVAIFLATRPRTTSFH